MKFKVTFYSEKKIKTAILLGMKTLHIYPTSRSIRHVKARYRAENRLLPTLMRIDEFEHRLMLLPNLKMVDPLLRQLLLREASHFEAFESLKINRDLVRFFTKGEAIFKFFEELSHEEVSFDALMDADAYAEFGEHIEILATLQDRYEEILATKGLTDRLFLPKIYQINRAFIDQYDRFEFHLEGSLSHFELNLLDQVAKHKPLIVHLQTSRFNRKLQERFAKRGIVLPSEGMVSFDLQSRAILSVDSTPSKISAQVWHVQERLEQIPLLLVAVQQMVNEGIDPDRIVVILPDERFKEQLQLYDRFKNFNFAMGFDYAKEECFKRLEAIYHYAKSFSKESRELLLKYGVTQEYLDGLSFSQSVGVEQFFEMLEPVGLDLERDMVAEQRIRFGRIFTQVHHPLSTWLFLWLNALKGLSLDDVRGGKVTVMGALETRGVAYDGVVIVDFNDGVVPAIPAKDAFLNSSVRQFANLPTKSDREALQKQLYKRILEQAKRATIIYALGDNRTPAGYLYELGLGLGDPKRANLQLLYPQASKISKAIDPIIKNFDARTITWSATRLKIFLSCKRKYYYHYVQQLKAPQEEINEGRVLHEILDKLFAEDEQFSDAIAMQKRLDYLLEEHPQLRGNDPKLHYLKALWRAKFKPFIETQLRHFSAGWRVMRREMPIGGTIRGVPFKGTVDRIDQTDTATLVLDYKSGSITQANRSKHLDKLTDFQMSIYARLLEGRVQNLSLAFVEVLNGGKITPVAALEEKSELLDEKIQELLSITELNCLRTEEVSQCQYCDYRLLCERGEYL